MTEGTRKTEGGGASVRWLWHDNALPFRRLITRSALFSGAIWRYLAVLSNARAQWQDDDSRLYKVPQ